MPPYSPDKSRPKSPVKSRHQSVGGQSRGQSHSQSGSVKEGGHSCPPIKKLMAGGKTRPPVIEAEAKETGKALKKILEKIRV